MTASVFLFYAALNAAFFCWALWVFLRFREPSTVPLLIVAFGLLYDNAILASGSLIGHGELLQRLSIPRFFMHAFGTPLLMLSALGLVRRTRLGWTRSRWLSAAVALLTLGMIAAGVASDLVGLQLLPKEAGDLVSYGNASSNGPPLAPLVTILVLAASGWLLWRNRLGPWLLLGSIVQFAAAAIGDQLIWAGNFGEVALMLGLLLADSRQKSGSAAS